jgi:hypothetical protein
MHEDQLLFQGPPHGCVFLIVKQTAETGALSEKRVRRKK